MNSLNTKAGSVDLMNYEMLILSGNTPYLGLSSTVVGNASSTLQEIRHTKRMNGAVAAYNRLNSRRELHR